MISTTKLWQRLTSVSHSTKSFLPATAQTKRSWARVVDSLDNVPAIYQDQVRAISEAHGCFPYTIVTPTYAGFLSKGSEKLICAFNEILYVLTYSSDHLESQSVEYSTITYTQHAFVLLKSWLKLTVAVTDTAPKQFVFRYNSASESCFIPLIEIIRSHSRIQSNPIDPIEDNNLQFLEQLDYKLFNYGVRGLLPNQLIRSTLYQPAVQHYLIRVHRAVLTRTLFPAHLSILTDNELILVSDGEQTHWHNNRRYGGVWTYVPLCMIDHVSVVDESKDLLTLKYDLADAESLIRKFRIEYFAEVTQFIQEIKQLRG